jgi:SAM-dependent methyltransferase
VPAVMRAGVPSISAPDCTALLLPEDAYGRAKRQAFVESVIQESNPRTVLDFGCGTGTQLTWPLAQAFPQVSFLGVDADETTIAWARKQPVPSNLVYATEDVSGPRRRYDMIIASEVLEHVESPDELLRHFRDRLADGGRLVVTVPNGHGPFETMSLIEHLFTLGGVLPVLRRIKHMILGKPTIDESQALTLAISPHINFFSLAAIKTLLRNAGFDVVRFRSRTLLCGFIIEWAIRGPLIAWNARLADRLPAWCASDWMFECVKAPAPPATISPWRRTPWGRFRRTLSERRWAGVSLPHQ